MSAWLTSARLALTLAVALGSQAAVAAEPGSAAALACAAPAAVSELGVPLAHSAALIAAGKPVLIVAVGSSSTSGVGASGPQETYPARLEIALRRRFPGADLRVLNRGKGGEDAGEELARLDRDVVAAHPDLVIWQVGTNAVLRRDDLAGDAILLDHGVAILRHDGVDVVLMDMQYAPRVLARRAYALMEELIAATAKRERVGLYRRFEVMRQWQKTGAIGALTGADGLHMTDASYDCLAINLADALAANWRAAAKGILRAPDAVAGLHGAARLPAARSRPLP
ncbi:MAG: SGNH/GDSL hydrolase family protein [Stellaceae bacterium]